MILVAAFAALAFMVPGIADPYQNPRLLALALVAFVMLLWPVREERRSSLMGYAAALVVAWCVAAVFSADRSYSLVGAYLAPFDGVIAASMYACLLAGAARMAPSLEDAAAAVCWASLPVSLYALWQRVYLNSDSWLPSLLPGGVRVVASQGSPVYLGAVLAIVAACAIALMARPGRIRFLGAAALALAGPALWFTQTRGAMLAAGAAAFVMLPRRARWAAVLAAVAVVFLHPRWSSRSDLGRLAVWDIAWKIFKDNPLTGSGPGTFYMTFRAYISPEFLAAHRNTLVTQAHAHNEVLHVLATTGILGLAAYVAMAYGAWRVWREQLPENRALLGAVSAAYAVAAQFNPLPHAAIALMAVFYGAASSRRGHGPRWNLVAAAAVAVFVAGGLVKADWHYARSAVATRAVHASGGMDLKARVTAMNEIQSAARANAYEIVFTGMQIDGMLSLLPLIEPSGRQFIGEETLRLARAAVERHPADSFAHEYLGRTLLTSAMLGVQGADPEAGLEELRLAQRLAPTFSPLMYRRISLARALGREDEVAAAKRDIARVRKLTGDA